MPRYRLRCLRRTRFRKNSKTRMALVATFFIVLILLITPLYIIYKPPHILIRYLQHHFPEVLWHVPTTRKIIALTIDDAPSPYTQEILEILIANNATATFFIIGSQIEDHNRQILQDLILAGNELGNHAMHDEPSRSLTNTELTHQIETVHSEIQKAYTNANNNLHHPHHLLYPSLLSSSSFSSSSSSQQPSKPIPQIPPTPPLYFRPGSGFFNQRILTLLQSLNYKLILGSIYPHDPQIPYWWINANHILSMVRPGGIIICHDRRAWTVPMLKKVLPELRREGWEVVSVGELLRVVVDGGGDGGGDEQGGKEEGGGGGGGE